MANFFKTFIILYTLILKVNLLITEIPRVDISKNEMPLVGTAILK